MGTEAEVTDTPSENTKTEEEEKEEDFCIQCSDDEEKYNPTKIEKGLWEPDPKDIVTLYEKLSKGEVFQLKWECAGRRSPSPERMEEDADADKDANAGQPDEEMEEEKPAEKTEFDFDDATAEIATKVTPRRTPGSAKSPRSQKRVARLDKIMSDIMRHKKLDEAEAAARAKVVKDKSATDSTPQRPSPKLKIRRDLLK